MQLQNRVAIVTGAGRGIGRAIALAYAKEGARLALVSRSQNELDEASAEAAAMGALSLPIVANVSNGTQVDQIVTQTLQEYSTVDILVNNAAILGPIAALEDRDLESWIHAIHVNLIGTYLCSRAVLPAMLKQKNGRIINVTSGVRARGADIQAYRHMAAYMASKAGVTRLTEILAKQLIGAGVQVNAMSPGGNTRMLEEILVSAE